jgi:CBS domain-containing protein
MTVGLVLKSKESSVISVAASATVLEVAQVISSRRIGAVLVLDGNGGVAGIVSERDVVKALAVHASKATELLAEDLMTRNVTTTTSQTTVDDAMEIMDAEYFRHLPVVNNGRLEGIISIRDLVKYRIMQHQHEVETMKAYISGTV